jgi:hypothetical protein
MIVAAYLCSPEQSLPSTAFPTAVLGHMEKTMPRKIQDKTRRAYERAGWNVNSSGRAIPPIGFGQLRPAEHPPGLSTLPLPRRRWREDRPAPEVPVRAASISEIPSNLALAYDRTEACFHRNVIGDALNDFRSQKVKAPNAEPLIRRCTMTRDQYATLQALAAPGQERENFGRAAATGRIKIEG